MSEDSKSQVRVASVKPAGEYALRIQVGKRQGIASRSPRHCASTSRLCGRCANPALFGARLRGRGVTASCGPAISTSAPLVCWNSASSRRPR